MAQPDLNLALVISELEVGGAEKNFTRLACEMHHRGHQVQVYSLDPRPANPQQAVFVRQLESQQIPVHFLSQVRQPLVLRLRHRLADLLEKQQPNLVQSFLFRANLLAVQAAPAALPVSLGIRQADPRRWVQWLENRLIRRAAGCVFVSQDTADHYRTTDHSIVIPNAVQPLDADQIKMAQANKEAFWMERLGVSLHKDSRVFLFVGRLTEQKNVAKLLNDMVSHLTRYPHDHFVIVGSGPLRASLEKAVPEGPVSRQIHLAGWQPEPESWMLHSDLLLLRSLWEGQPNVILEAMAAGIPFLATHTHGLNDIFSADQGSDSASETSSPEITRDKEVAFRSQCVPDSAFMAQLDQLCQQPSLRNELGHWNHNWICRFFSPTKMADRYEHFFRKLANN